MYTGLNLTSTKCRILTFKIGLSFIRMYFHEMAPNLKSIKQASMITIAPNLDGTMKRTSSGSPVISPKQVFSLKLCHTKTWYAVNSSQCCSKPGTFCSTTSARYFEDEYRAVNLEDLVDEHGAPASFKWFSNFCKSGKVYVATPFGLLLGILRLKSLEQCEFLRTDVFTSLVTEINSRGFGALSSKTEADEVAHLKRKVSILEVQLSLAAKEIVQIRRQREQDSSLPDTPPSTPSNSKSPPTKSPPKTLDQIKKDPDLSPSIKKKKSLEVASSTLDQLSKLCEAKGESLGAVLGECCLLEGEDEGDCSAISHIHNVFLHLASEVGVKEACERLIPDETWKERIQSMRSPDWVYFLFKLKARLSDNAWQQMTNLTKLGRSGVRKCRNLNKVYNYLSLLYIIY